MLQLSLVLILSLIQLGIESEDKISVEQVCTCHDKIILSYECKVMGSQFGTTVWYGSAFDCAGTSGEISLLHFLYTDDTVSHARASGECNKGSIVAQGLRTENDTYYVSRLNVTVTADIIGKNIECIYDGNTGIPELIIDSRNISISGKI